jgi:hypothetical protein
MTTITLSPQECLFPLGTVDVADAVNRTVPAEDVSAALARHARGDWGDVSEEDEAQNDLSLMPHAGRLCSVYHDRYGVKFRIITDGDRSKTSILLARD